MHRGRGTPPKGTLGRRARAPTVTPTPRSPHQSPQPCPKRGQGRTSPGVFVCAGSSLSTTALVRGKGAQMLTPPWAPEGQDPRAPGRKGAALRAGAQCWAWLAPTTLPQAV